MKEDGDYGERDMDSERDENRDRKGNKMTERESVERGQGYHKRREGMERDG